MDLYKIPVSIKSDLDRYSDKDGSITMRDYTVVQFREEGKVKYSVDREDKAPIDLSEKQKYMKDHQKMLNDAYNEVWGTPGEEAEEEPEQEAPKATVKKSPEQKKAEKKAADKEAVEEWADDKGDPPSEPAAEKSEPQQDESEEDVELDEDELRNMDASQVRGFFKYTSTEAPDTDDVDKLVDALIEALS